MGNSVRPNLNKDSWLFSCRSIGLNSALISSLAVVMAANIAQAADLEQSLEGSEIKALDAQVTDNKAADFSVPKDFAMGIKHQSYDFASLEDTDAKLAMDYSQIKLPLGKYDVRDSFFVPTLSVEKTAFRFENTEQDNQEAYTIKTQFMFVTPTDEKWTRILQVTPSLHTDLDAIDEDAFSLMGLAIWRYQASDISAWTMGVGFNRLFGEYKPIPLISYQYLAAEGLQLDLGFPITKAEYRFNSNWSSYASIAPVGGNWRYETEQHEKLNISYTSWVTGLGIRYQVKPKLWASIELGQSLARKLNLDADNEINDANIDEVDIADAPVLMLSFGFHP